MNKVILLADGEHSPLGPSSSERWMECPGSVKASEGAADKDSIFALEGTAAHRISELARITGDSAKQWLGDVVRIKTTTATHDIPVDQAMVDGVDTFVEFVESIEGDAFYEMRVAYEKYVPKGFGTADDIRIDAGTGICTITDFKYGKGIQVYAERNSQLMLYALGVLCDYGWLYKIKKFVFNISQPRLDHLDTWECSVAEVLEFANKAEKQAQIARSPNAPFKAGNHCQFCRIKQKCRVRAEWVMGQAVGEFEDLDDAINKMENLDADMEQADIAGAPWVSNEELARLLGVLNTVKSWCKDIALMAVAEIRAGREVGDYKMVAGRGSRSWDAPEDEIAEELEADYFLSDNQIFKRKLLTPPQAEELLGKKAEILKTKVKKNPGKPKLAPGSDRRPALPPEALTAFENLDDDDEDDSDF